MHPKRPLRIPAELDVIPFARDVVDPDQLYCPDCSEPLRTCQPVVESPDRLVGTCDGCENWYLIQADWGADVLMVLLPTREWFRTIAPLQRSSEPSKPEAMP